MRKMNLILIAALIAASSAAKLDRSYLPPASAKTAGGNPDNLQTPFTRSSQNQGLGGLPSGSYENEFQGVVVDAANPGTRTAGTESGLGGPRVSYGSADSKVGEAAFRGSLTGFRQTGQGFNNNGQFGAQGTFGSTENKSERPQAAKDRAANTVKQDSDVGSETYSYGYETDNGIAAVENGIAINGVQAQGGFSYKGDDGQTYSITYTADEGGYRPQGSHLPTPPPIPEEILKSLEQNAKDEAAGLVDDGSYDAQKYNEGDYSGGDNTNSGNSQSQFGKRPGGSFIQNQAFGKPSSNSGYSGTNGYRPNVNNIGQSASSISGTESQSGGDNNNAGNSQSHFGTRPGGASFNQNQAFGKPSSNSGYSGSNNYQVNGNNNDQAASSLSGTGLQGNDNTNAGNIQTQFGTQPGTAFNQNYGFGKPSTSSVYTGINGYQPNGNNKGQTNQFQSGLNTYNHGASAQELNPQGQNVDSSSGHVSPNQASAQAHSYGNGQASAQASTGPQFGQTNKFANQGTFGSQSQQSARPQFGAQPSRPQFGQSQSPSNNQASQISSLSQVDSQSLQPDAEESSSNVDSSLNQGQNVQSSANIQSIGGQRPQQGVGFQSSFNRPSSSQPSQTSYNSGSGFVSAPNNANAFAVQAGQTNANAFASNNEYLPPGNDGFGSKPIQGLPQKPVASPALPLNQFSASQTGNNFESQVSQGSPGFQTNQASLDAVRPTLGSGSQFNSFQQTQTLSNVRPTQFPLNANGAATQGQFKPQYPNSGQSGIPAQPTQSSFGFSQATKQPETELTTPLEPNDSSPSKVKEVQPTDSSASSFASVGSKPNFSKPQFASQAFGAKPSSIRPGQAILGVQSPFTSQSSAFTGSPSKNPQSSNPLIASNQPQSNFNAQSFSGSQPADKEPQLGQNTFSQNRPGDAQFASSTQKPTYGQIGQSQGIDDSYYYNHPSKPFNTPPFGAKIPSALSNQFNSGQFSGNRPQNFPLNSVSSTAQLSQNLGSSLASVAPTSPTQNMPAQIGSTSSTYNGITQASISPFGAAPTPATQFNKPAQPMPATQFGSQQTQFGVKPLAQRPLSEHSQSSQFSFQQNQFGSKPQQPSSVPTQFGNKPTQQFGFQYNQQTAQPKPDSQFNSQQQQFGSPQSQFAATPLSQQPLVDHKQPNQPSSSTQFGSQQSQFSSQQGQFGIKPISQQPLAGSNQPAQPATSTQFGSQPSVDNNIPAQPTPSSQFGFQQTQFGSQQTQFGVTPLSQQPLVDNNTPSKPTLSTQFGSQQNQFGSQQTQFGVKPQQNEPSKPTNSFQFGSQQTQFGIKPTPQQPLPQFNQQASQFGSQSSQFDIKPQKPIGQFGQTTFSQTSVESKPSTQDTPNVPSQQYSGELYEYNKPDPVPTSSSESSAGNNVASAQASVTTGQTDSSAAQTQEVSQPTFGPQVALNTQSSQSSQFGAQPIQPFGVGQTSQVAQSTVGTKPQFPAFGKPCCQGQSKPTQSAFEGPSKPSTTGFQVYKPNQASQGFGKGEVFGGPRDPPRYDDKTGYHY